MVPAPFAKKVAWVAVALLSVAFPGCGADDSLDLEQTTHAAINDSPDVIVQYHVWFDTTYGPESTVDPTSGRSTGKWGLWDLNTKSDEDPSLPTPDSVEPDGWTRHSIHTRDYYPKMGLHDPDDENVLRWDIRLAKAAGIKAFAVSLYNWGGGLGEQRLAEVFRKMLRIAHEEDFRLTWEVWWGGDNLLDFFGRYGDIVNDPNFYWTDGKPLIWIAPSPPPYDYFGDTAAELTATLDAIRDRIGVEPIWALNDGAGIDLSQVQAPIIAMSATNLNSTFDVFQERLEENVHHAHDLDIPIGAHVLPGFDDSGLREEVRYTPRDGGQTLIRALNAARDQEVDFIFLESWNDFGEAHAIEPGMKEDYYSEPYRRDDFKDLRIISAFHGREFVPPALPVESMDPLVRRRESHLLEFQATASLGEGALCSNGVRFALIGLYNDQWVELAGENVGPLDGDVEIKVAVPEVYGRERTLILAADALGDACADWAHWVDARITVDGKTVYDFIENAPWAYWHSTQGTIPWGTGGPLGTAMYGYNVKTSSGATPARTLYVHPDYSANGFSHGGFGNLTLLAP